MENHEKLKVFAGCLLIISAITHIGQFFVFGFELHDIGAVIFGIAYGLLGFRLITISIKDISLKWKKVMTFGGIILPIIGGSLGLNRLINVEIKIMGVFNWFIVIHIIIDCIVVPICIYSLLQLRKI